MVVTPALVATALITIGCGRLGFDPAASDPDAIDASPDVTQLIFDVCKTGCGFPTIQSAVDQAVIDTNPRAMPIIIEVKDSATFAENVTITAPVSGVSLTLRAAPGVSPVISGSGGTGAATVSIAGDNVRVSGFTFAGTAQRGIAVSSPNVTLDHNLFSGDFDIWDPDQFFRGTCILLSVAGTERPEIVNNTFYDCQESIEIIDAPAAGNVVTLRNNIFVQLTQNRPEYEPILWFKPSVSHYALSSNNNLFYYTGNECIAWDDATGPITSLAMWQARGHDGNGIGTGIDPLLADPDNYDFHERSSGGRFQPGIGWVIDAATSRAVDTGDRIDPVGDESAPNGNLINLGGHGGTVEASRSP
jgi:hypothetical protein